MSEGTPERLLWFPVIGKERVRARAAQSEPALAADKEGTTDEELLARIQQGDYAAVETLFGRYYKLLIGIGFRILRDRGEAEDLVQDIFVRLCERSNTFDHTKGSARTWIVQMAYRRAFDHRSYLARRSFYSGTNLEAIQNALEGGSGLEEEIAARITAEQLHEAFEELNEKQRQTLELFFFEGLDLREVAERLGETFENARHYYYRGLERVRRKAAAMARPKDKGKR